MELEQSSECCFPESGLEVLAVQQVSKAQAWQRAGRAGRQHSGICYRLYTEDDFEKFLNMTVPEIQRWSLVLQLSLTVCCFIVAGYWGPVCFWWQIVRYLFNSDIVQCCLWPSLAIPLVFLCTGVTWQVWCCSSWHLGFPTFSRLILYPNHLQVRGSNISLLVWKNN